jgi:putative oxidoreductase
MKCAATIARYLLGVLCLVFGANKFLQFMPTPEAFPPNVEVFMKGIMAAGYIMPTVGVIFILVGICLVIGMYVPLALLILVPVTYNIFMMHLVLDPATGVMAYIVTVLNIFLLVAYKKAYKSLMSCGCCCKSMCKKEDK